MTGKHPKRQKKQAKKTAIAKILILALSMIVVAAMDSFYYTYTYDIASLAYAANITVSTSPQLPIARPSNYYIVSDVTTPGDTAYIRGLILSNNTDTFNQSIFIVYLENPDICFPPWNPVVCFADVTLTISIYDDNNVQIFTNTTSGFLVFRVAGSPSNGAYTIVDLNIQPPVPINSTHTVKASVTCNVGC